MSEIIPLAKSYVQQLLTQLPESHYYHDWKHTQEVYDEASHLGVMAKLSEDQMEQAFHRSRRVVHTGSIDLIH